MYFLEFWKWRGPKKESFMILHEIFPFHLIPFVWYLYDNEKRVMERKKVTLLSEVIQICLVDRYDYFYCEGSEGTSISVVHWSKKQLLYTSTFTSLDTRFITRISLYGRYRREREGDDSISFLFSHSVKLNMHSLVVGTLPCHFIWWMVRTRRIRVWWCILSLFEDRIDKLTIKSIVNIFSLT